MYGFVKIMYGLVVPHRRRVLLYIGRMCAKFVRPVVLVVDDDAGVRDSLHLVLDEDYDVLDAANGRTAIALAGSVPIDLVVLDILLPDTDGIHLLTEIDALRPGIRVVVLSGLDKASIATAAIRLGATDYVTKPFDDEMLLSVVRTALHGPPGTGSSLSDRRPPTITCIGCEVTVVAGIAATLQGDVDVQSEPEPSARQVEAGACRPKLFIIDLGDCRSNWLDRAGLLLERHPATARIALVNPGTAVEARFALGEGCLVLERPFQFTALLDTVGTLLPDALTHLYWRDERTAAVVNHVCTRYASVSLQELARGAGVSTYYLSRWFLERTGMPLSTYVKLVRVQAARHLLQHTLEKIDAIAAAVGFHDASHLSRAFVKVTGRRPGQDRTEGQITRKRI